jgi:hypothetical protein
METALRAITESRATMTRDNPDLTTKTKDARGRLIGGLARVAIGFAMCAALILLGVLTTPASRPLAQGISGLDAIADELSRSAGASSPASSLDQLRQVRAALPRLRSSIDTVRKDGEDAVRTIRFFALLPGMLLGSILIATGRLNARRARDELRQLPAVNTSP